MILSFFLVTGIKEETRSVDVRYIDLYDPQSWNSLSNKILFHTETITAYRNLKLYVLSSSIAKDNNTNIQSAKSLDCKLKLIHWCCVKSVCIQHVWCSIHCRQWTMTPTVLENSKGIISFQS